MENKKLKAILVGLTDSRSKFSFDEHIRELEGLSKTAGIKKVGDLTQDKNRITPGYFLGKGKLEELKDLKKTLKANIIIFDDDISPSQSRNLEKFLECVIVDRCGLILQIFKEHARSKESKIQVELAELDYSLPRLTGQWTHLSRQKGGIGLREVGEKQLELDKRIIKNKIYKLKKRLKGIEKERSVQRKPRELFFTAALVGYTNAGKSTIMNALTGANLLVEDKLFATLDSTVRTIKSVFKERLLLSDTVGFIDKLPHQLVASFKSTLDEVRYSNLLLKVVDASSDYFEHHMKIIEKTLSEMGLFNSFGIWVFNKTDLIGDERLQNLKERFSDSIFLSATTNTGIKDLVCKIEDFYKINLIEKEINIDYKNKKLLSYIHKAGNVSSLEYNNDGVLVKFSINKSNIPYVESLLKIT